MIFLTRTKIKFEFLSLNITLVILTAVLILSESKDSSFIILVGITLIILSIWLRKLIISANYYPKNFSLFIKIIYLILIALLLAFYAEKILRYYFFFEVGLLPIFILIMGWGYQPERLLASLFIFFYTVIASLPLLIVLLNCTRNLGTTNFLLFHFADFNLSFFNSMIIIVAFLVKLPIFGVHLWLPKAHVEAPVSGSIILAGVLLKLGGYGLILSSLIRLNIFLAKIVIIISIFGGSILALEILVLLDIKVIIAYSSVVHMSIVSALILSELEMGIIGAVLMIISHGFTSSAIFSGANIIYERSHTRRIILNKGLLSLNPRITIFWFIILVINFAGPFTINLAREIIMINSLLFISKINIIPVFFLCFFSLCYNLILYATLQHGQFKSYMNSYKRLNLREILNLFSHIWPGLFLLFIAQL